MNLFKVTHSFLISTWLVIKIIVMHHLKKSSIQEQDPHIEHWAKRLIHIAQVDLTLNKPKENSTSIVMCNHASLYDIPLSYLAFPNAMRMFGKQELFNLPLWGKAMVYANHLPLDRKNARAAKKSLDKAKNALNQGTSLWIAPEGTRSVDGQLQAFKSGGFKLAWETKTPITCLLIHNAHAIVTKHSFQINLKQKVSVKVGKVFHPNDYTSMHELKDAVFEYFKVELNQ